MQNFCPYAAQIFFLREKDSKQLNICDYQVKAQAEKKNRRKEEASMCLEGGSGDCSLAGRSRENSNDPGTEQWPEAGEGLSPVCGRTSSRRGPAAGRAWHLPGHRGWGMGPRATQTGRAGSERPGG